MTMKRRFPFRQFHRSPPVYSLRVHWVPLFPSSHRLGAFAVSPHPGVPSFPGFRLLCPIRLSVQALAFRWGLPCLLPTRLDIPHEVSRVQPGRLQWNETGGVFLSLPHPLSAAPQSLDRGYIRLTSATCATVSGRHGSLLTALVSAFWLDWLTSETREVRVSVQPKGLTTLQVMHQGMPQPSHHLLGACLSLMGPFRSMPLTP
jgi:hypothetical protein